MDFNQLFLFYYGFYAQNKHFISSEIVDFFSYIVLK